jgi:flagellar biosynthetic protein FliR
MQALPDPTHLMIGALAFLRVSAILFALPMIGDPPTPVRVRVLLALAVTIGIFPVIPPNWAPNLNTDLLTISSYLLREVLIGLTIGFFSRVTFDGLMMGATVVSFQMGFGTANLFMPDYNERMDSFSALHRMLVMLIFLTLSLHHIFFTAIADTFQLIPGGAAHFSGPLTILLIKLTSGILSIAIELAAPILVALLFTMAALGLVARAVPNMNAFVISFPLSFTVGLVIYMATLPLFPGWMSSHFSEMNMQLHAAIRSLNLSASIP